MKTKYKFLMGIKIIAGITFFVILFGFGTMHLWNWLIPSLFHGPIITFCEAIGLLILSKILFGRFGHKFGRSGCCGHGGHESWKYKMQERCGNMTQEEKEQFKQRFKEKCGNKFWMNKEETKTPD